MGSPLLGMGFTMIRRFQCWQCWQCLKPEKKKLPTRHPTSPWFVWTRILSREHHSVLCSSPTAGHRPCQNQGFLLNIKINFSPSSPLQTFQRNLLSTMPTAATQPTTIHHGKRFRKYWPNAWFDRHYPLARYPTVIIGTTIKYQISYIIYHCQKNVISHCDN